MAPDIPWNVKVQDHPGSTANEIANEPDWGAGHSHRIGFKNKQGRMPGITHQNDEYDTVIEEARGKIQRMREEAKEGKLINFRDVIQNQTVSPITPRNSDEDRILEAKDQVSIRSPNPNIVRVESGCSARPVSQYLLPR